VRIPRFARPLPILEPAVPAAQAVVVRLSGLLRRLAPLLVDLRPGEVGEIDLLPDNDGGPAA